MLHRHKLDKPRSYSIAKSVHFNTDLDRVCYFFQNDKPNTLDTSIQPLQTRYSEDELENNSPENEDQACEWEITIPHCLINPRFHHNCIIQLESLWLSDNQDFLLGSVVVANLAYEKNVACRFTFDSWKTISEVKAEYCCGAHIEDDSMAYDRFIFTLYLKDISFLWRKKLYLCVRYAAVGQEFWDNNNCANYEVVFRQKVLSNGLAVQRLTKGQDQRSKLSLKTNGDSLPHIASKPTQTPKLNSNQLHYWPPNFFSSNCSIENNEVLALSHSLIPTNGAFGRRYDLATTLTAECSK